MLKHFFLTVVILLAMLCMIGCTWSNHTKEEASLDENAETIMITDQIENEYQTELEMQIGNQTFIADLYDNASAKAFIDILPITLEMNEMNGNEKYYYLDNSLPIDSKRVEKINEGDIMLYGSDCLVLFYDSFPTSYSYTKLGKIRNIDGLKDVLGKSNAQVTFKLAEQTADNSKETEKGNMLISVQGNEKTAIFQLNDSPASKTLFEQLPFTVEVKDYSTNEKIFYPPETLDTADSLPAEGKVGTLAYFSPWGNVVMYYGSFGAYDGLYDLGHVISGGEYIEEMTGLLKVDIVTQ